MSKQKQCADLLLLLSLKILIYSPKTTDNSNCLIRGLDEWASCLNKHQ